MFNIYIREKEDIISAIKEYGILPFFSNEIKGFSIEENCDPRVYFNEEPGVWEWKGPVIQETKCAYGKFFQKKAAYVKEGVVLRSGQLPPGRLRFRRPL